MLFVNIKVLISIVFSLVLGFTHSRAMEANASKILSLKNLVIMQIAQESDVEKLKNHIAHLDQDLALQVLSFALAFNFELYSVAKCELVASFRTRKCLSVALEKQLQRLERKLLLGGSLSMDTDIGPEEESHEDE